MPKSLVLVFATFILLGTLNNTEVMAQENRSWIGVVLDETDSEEGVAIATVLRRSPAHEAGIRDGDRILSVDGEMLRTPATLTDLLRRQPVGRTLRIELERSGENFRVELRLTPAPSPSEVHRVHFQNFAAPEITLTTLDDELLELPRANDRTLVLSFWATWCGVCRRVSRQLEAYLAEHPGAFEVFEVTAEDAAAVRAHLRTRPKSLPIALDPGRKTHTRFLVNSYPMVVFITPDNRILDVSTTISDLETILDERTFVANQKSD